MTDDFLQDRLRRAGDILRHNPKDPTGEIFSISHLDYHHDDWERILGLVPDLHRHIRSLWTSHDFVPDFYEDLFNLLFQGMPILTPEDQMHENREVSYKVTSGLHDDTSTHSLRLNTRFDIYCTAMAMLSMKEKLEDAFSKMEEVQRRERERQAARDAAQQAMRDLAQKLQEMLDAAAKADQQPDGSPEQQEAAQELNDATDALEQAMQAAQDALAQLGVTIQSIASQGTTQANLATAVIQVAMDEAARDLADEMSLFHSYGIEDGVLKSMDFEERRRLAAKLKSGRLGQFAALIGAFRLTMMAERRRKVISAPSEVSDVTLGNDVSKLTPSARALMVPETEDLFWMKWVSGGLEMYETRGWERLGRGPIIFVGDESGSMEARLGKYNREAWMKAFALALLAQAREENRDFIYIGFSSPGQQWAAEFNGPVDIEKLVELGEHFWGGGTHYERPLQKALGYVQEAARKNLPKGDIVFCSDDEYPSTMPEEFLEELRRARDEHDLRTFGIALGCNPSNAMTLVCDDIRAITHQTADPDKVADIFRVM